MRRKFSTSRRVKTRAFLAVLALFTAGLLVSGALAEPAALSTLTGRPRASDSTAASSTDTTGASSTDTTSTDTTSTGDTSTSPDSTTDTTSTDTSTTSTDTTSSASGTVPYIVSFASGTSAADQQAALDAAGATEQSAVAALRMHFVTFPADTAPDSVAALKANSSVRDVEQDKTRDASTAPNDPAYADQWALPRIGWDNVYGNVNPAGSATVAILDTGVDGSHPDLAGNLVPGTSILDGSTARPTRTATAPQMAGIVAAETDNGDGHRRRRLLPA